MMSPRLLAIVCEKTVSLAQDAIELDIRLMGGQFDRDFVNKVCVVLGLIAKGARAAAQANEEDNDDGIS